MTLKDIYNKYDLDFFNLIDLISELEDLTDINLQGLKVTIACLENEEEE